MTIALKRVESAEDLQQFIRFPRSLYSKETLWVPLLDQERKRFLDPRANPFFNHAEADYFLALSSQGHILGRIAATVDHDYNTFHNEQTGFFGLFECVPDKQASTTLLDAAEQWCRERGMHRMIGPMNLSTNHECGLLVENFDDPPVLGILYNPPYYAELFRQWGLQKIKDLISFEIRPTQVPEYLQKAASLIKKRNRFTLRTLRMNRFDREVEVLWEIYNSAWESNWGFVPMQKEEFFFTAREIKTIVNPELCFIAEVKGEAAGFSLCLPDVNPVLRSMNGKLFPFGWLKFILGKSKINRYRVITCGVKKRFQRLGIDALIYHATYIKMLEINILKVDMSWVLEDNQAMIGPIEKFGGRPYKRHRIYERTLTL